MSHHIIPVNFQQTNQIYNQNQHKKTYKAHQEEVTLNHNRTTTIKQQKQKQSSFTEECILDDCSPIRETLPSTRNNMSCQKHLSRTPSGTSRVHDLSPIKPSFVGNQNQFGHSTPNHILQGVSGNVNNPKTKNQKQLIQVNSTIDETRTTVKKETIVKELAVNILELNQFRTRTEELDNKLKSFDQMKQEKNKPSDLYTINEKSETIKNELTKLKAEMLQKIEDIHQLEVELVQIEGHNTSSKINRAQINSLAHRNEAVMAEIKRMLSDTKSPLTATKIIEDYSKEAQRLQQHLSNSANSLQSCIQERFDHLRTQIDKEYSFLKNRFYSLDGKLRKEGLSAHLAEAECLRSLIASAKEKFTNEIGFLCKDYEHDVYLVHHFGVQRMALEAAVTRHQSDLQMLTRDLYSAESWDISSRQSKEASFLNEEAEQIKKISQKIKQIRSRMDAQRRSGVAEASSGDEADTRELAQLNEQIKHLKTQMLAKGNELSKRPSKSKSCSNDAFINTTTTTTSTNNNSPPRTGPVYLPVHHLQRNRSLSPATVHNLFVEGSFKAEPVQVWQSGDTNYFEHNPDASNSNRNYFAVDKSNARNLHCSPDRRYKSSVEIPAEHLETLKAQNRMKNSHNRSRSLSSSSFISSESMVVTKEEHHHHHHEQHQKRISTKKTVYVNSSSSGSEKQKHQQDLLVAKEVESLRQLLAERNTIIERQKLENELQKQQLFYLNENKINDLQSNQNLLTQLESQQALIISMKMKLNEKSAELKQQEQEKDAQQQQQKQKNQTESILSKPEDVKKLNLPHSKDPELANALVCNIPEHHKLEDMVHRNQEIIAKLKVPITNTHQFAYYTDDLILMEKKAEFEALDLAINNRKQQLVNMEFARNRRLNDSYSTDCESFLKEEIFCLEETLHRRNKELNKIENELKGLKREVSHAKETKIKIERDVEILMKKNTMVNKEMFIFDRKAEEATVELLLAQEQLENVKEQKKLIEANIDALRFDLFGYLKTVQAEFEFSGGQSLERLFFNNHCTEFELRYCLNDLTNEISARKDEINTLKDRSQSIHAKFKADILEHEKALRKTKSDEENLQKSLLQVEKDIADKTVIINEKVSIIEDLEASIVKLKKNKEDSEDQVAQLDDKLGDKCNELEHIEKLIAKFMDNLESMRADELDMHKGLEKLSADIQNEKETQENVKRSVETLNQQRESMEAKVNAINEMISKVGEEYEKREQALIKLNNLTKEKQALMRREREEIVELQAQKEQASQEANLSRDRARRKKIELDRLEQNCRVLETDGEARVEQNAEVKRQYEILVGAIQEGESKLKELISRNKVLQQQIDQVENDLNERRNECSNLESYLQELREDIQTEKRSLNDLQSEQIKQKKVIDELRYKRKNCNRIISSAQTEINNNKLDEMNEEIRAKSDYINELEGCLMDKNKELASLKQSFLKNQEETSQFKNRLIELEQATRFNAQTENDLLHFLNSNLDAESDYLADTKPPFHHAQPVNTKAMLGNLLITPSLKKAYSNNLMAMLDINQEKQPKKAFNEELLHFKTPPVKLEKLEEKTNRLIEDQEMYKQNLLLKCSEKMASLDASKQQTRFSIEQLRNNLHEIELLTANNIFKITGSKNY